MSYTVKHGYVDEEAPETITTNGDFATVHSALSGNFRIRFPGDLLVSRSVTYFVRTTPENPDGSAGKASTQRKTLPLTVEIRKPNGALFTSDHITLDDLNEFRDLRGTSQGEWTFDVRGESAPIFIDKSETRVIKGNSRILITGIETVASKSAPALVNAQVTGSSGKRFTFDLFRVGTFTATAAQRSMILFDPDGKAVATGMNRLRFPVTLETIDKSRDAAGSVRRWALQVLPGLQFPSTLRVSATVIESARIRSKVLQDRINFLIGEHGSKLSIRGETTDDRLLVRLTILDKFSAETIGIHDLLDSIIRSEEQDAGVDTDIRENVAYTLAHVDRDLDHGLRLTDFALRVDSIGIGPGASEEIQPPIPALKLKLGLVASTPVEFRGITLATARIGR